MQNRSILFGKPKPNELWRMLDEHAMPAGYMVTEPNARPIACVPDATPKALKVAKRILHNPDYWSKSCYAIDLRGDTFYRCLLRNKFTGKSGWLDGAVIVRVHDDGRMKTAEGEFGAVAYGIFLQRSGEGVTAGSDRFAGSFDQWCEHLRLIKVALQIKKSGTPEPSNAAHLDGNGSEWKAIPAAACA